MVMRFAELVQQHRARDIVERAVSTDGANSGLRELAPDLLRSVEDLATPDDQR